MRRLRKEACPISFMKHHDAAGLDLGRQGSKGGGGVRKKLKNEAANNCVERCIGWRRPYRRLNEAHIVQSEPRCSCPRLRQCGAVEINADYFAARPNEPGHKESDITDPRPYVQYALAGTNPRIAE